MIINKVLSHHPKWIFNGHEWSQMKKYTESSVKNSYLFNHKKIQSDLTNSGSDGSLIVYVSTVTVWSACKDTSDNKVLILPLVMYVWYSCFLCACCSFVLQDLVIPICNMNETNFAHDKMQPADNDNFNILCHVVVLTPANVEIYKKPPNPMRDQFALDIEQQLQKCSRCGHCVLLHCTSQDKSFWRCNWTVCICSILYIKNTFHCTPWFLVHQDQK